MKIALFHELHSGGAQRTVIEFGKRLKKRNTVDLFYVDEKNNNKEKEYFNSIFFYKFIPKKWHGGDWKTKLYKDSVELYRLYKLHKHIAQRINERNYDVVFVHPSQYTQAPFVLRFLKTKKVYYCQEPLRMVYESAFATSSTIQLHKRIYEWWNRAVRKKLDKKNISYADSVIANSLHSKKNIKRAYNITAKISYLGVDEKMFHPASIKKESDVLFVGHDNEIDGLPLLQAAIPFMKATPTVKIHISGKDWLADDKAFARLYAKAKVVVCLAKNEPFGLIPLEAMSCGVPVVAVNEGGYKESIINGKTGYLLARNPKELAKKLDYLLSHPDRAKTMGQYARKHVVENWTWERQTERLEAIL